MKVTEIIDPFEISCIRKAFYKFEVPPNISVLVHEFRIDGHVVGYVATEDFNYVGGPHLYVHEAFRNRLYLGKMTELLQGSYSTMMRDRGMKYLLTNCDQADAGTINFLKLNGFSIKKTIIAEKVL